MADESLSRKKSGFEMNNPRKNVTIVLRRTTTIEDGEKSQLCKPCALINYAEWQKERRGNRGRNCQNEYD